MEINFLYICEQCAWTVQMNSTYEQDSEQYTVQSRKKEWKEKEQWGQYALNTRYFFFNSNYFSSTLSTNIYIYI